VPALEAGVGELIRDASGCLKYRKNDGTIVDTCAGAGLSDIDSIIGDDVLFLDEDFDGAGASSFGRYDWRLQGPLVGRYCEAGHPGVIELSVNAAGENSSFLGLSGHTLGLTLTGSDTREHLLPSEQFTAKFWFAAKTLLAGGVNDPNSGYRVGFSLSENNTGGAGQTAEGIFFRKRFDVSDGKWQAVCRSGGSEAGSVEDIVLGTNDWLKLTIQRAGSAIRFTYPGQSPIDITANIPTVPLVPLFQVIGKNSETKNIKVDRYKIVVTGLSRG